MLTPADIENKRFSTTRLKEGYDQNEVDSFLDDAGAALVTTQRALEDAERRCQAYQSRIQRLTEAPTSVQAAVTPSAVAERLLAAAQVAADQHQAEAKAAADQEIREAGAKAAKMIEQATDAASKIEAAAREEAERIKNDGYAEKYKAFQELEVRHQTMTSAVNELDTRGRSIREALSEALSRYDSRGGSSGN